MFSRKLVSTTPSFSSSTEIQIGHPSGSGLRGPGNIILIFPFRPDGCPICISVELGQRAWSGFSRFVHFHRYVGCTIFALMNGPLKNRVILDCSALLPGPFVGKLLAGLGAKVYKIE